MGPRGPEGSSPPADRPKRFDESMNFDSPSPRARKMARQGRSHSMDMTTSEPGTLEWFLRRRAAGDHPGEKVSLAFLEKFTGLSMAADDGRFRAHESQYSGLAEAGSSETSYFDSEEAELQAIAKRFASTFRASQQGMAAEDSARRNAGRFSCPLTVSVDHEIAAVVPPEEPKDADGWRFSDSFCSSASTITASWNADTFSGSFVGSQDLSPVARSGESGERTSPRRPLPRAPLLLQKNSLNRRSRSRSPERKMAEGSGGEVTSEGNSRYQAVARSWSGALHLIGKSSFSQTGKRQRRNLGGLPTQERLEKNIVLNRLESQPEKNIVLNRLETQPEGSRLETQPESSKESTPEPVGAPPALRKITRVQSL